jgi:hypothetical protein
MQSELRRSPLILAALGEYPLQPFPDLLTHANLLWPPARFVAEHVCKTSHRSHIIMALLKDANLVYDASLADAVHPHASVYDAGICDGAEVITARCHYEADLVRGLRRSSAVFAEILVDYGIEAARIRSMLPGWPTQTERSHFTIDGIIHMMIHVVVRPVNRKRPGVGDDERHYFVPSHPVTELVTVVASLPLLLFLERHLVPLELAQLGIMLSSVSTTLGANGRKT